MKNSDIILDRKVGSITFIVDRDLPSPDSELGNKMPAAQIEASILSEENMSLGSPDILAVDHPKTKLYYVGRDVFFQTLVRAYAEHRPVVISPDMIWSLICQGLSYHINLNPEKYRELMVRHEGRKSLTVHIAKDGDLSADDWADIIDEFAVLVDENTKDTFASSIVADFSTSGKTESIASRITLLDCVKAYFEYVVIHMICGIPHVTLKGTPDDWQKIIDRVRDIARFDLEWWTTRLIPVLDEFIKTANGHPSPIFWKSIVMTWRPEQIRGRGCAPTKEGPTMVDGWFLNFFPYCRDGRTPDMVSIEETMLPETVSVPFIYKKTDASGNVKEEHRLNMTAGMIGVQEDRNTKELTPIFGWFISKDDSEDSMYEKMEDEDNRYGIHLRVAAVPEVLKRFRTIKSLTLEFMGNVVLPEWMDRIQIQRLTISGKLTRNEKKVILKRFPLCFFDD